MTFIYCIKHSNNKCISSTKKTSLLMRMFQFKLLYSLKEDIVQYKVCASNCMHRYLTTKNKNASEM